MPSLIPPRDAESDLELVPQRALLAMARDLDRLGRRSQQFLFEQLQQLESAVDEFEREKAAWRRQQQREAAELDRQRQLLRQQTSPSSNRGNDGPSESRHQPSPTAQDITRQAAFESGTAPVKFLVAPGTASAQQLGLLLFEISQLNREMGGGGVRFEFSQGRRLSGGLLGRKSPQVLIELDGFSAVPLTLDYPPESRSDVDGDLELWTNFKAQILLSAGNRPDLAEDFRKARQAPPNEALRGLILEATRRADDAVAYTIKERRSVQPAFRPVRRVDTVRQQIERLETIATQLECDCGVRFHAALHRFL